MGHQLGLTAKLYIDAAGVGQGTWAEVTLAQDVTLNMERAEGEVRNRSRTWAGVLTGLLSGSVEFELTYDPTDTEFDALRAAFTGGGDIGVAVYDQAITADGAEGLQADCKVTSFSRNEPLEDVVTVSVTLKPSAASSTAPAWTVISV